MMNPVYETLYEAVVPGPEKDGFLLLGKSLLSGPIFHFFLKADLTTFEGFLNLTQQVGISGFSYLDAGLKEDNKPLGGQLKRFRDGELDGMVKSYIKKFYDRAKDQLLEDQEAFKLFHRWFMEGYHPFIQKRLPGASEKRPYPALLLYRLYRDQGWKPKTQEEKQNFSDLDRIHRALFFHLSHSRVGIIEFLLPRLVFVAERISKVSKITKTPPGMLDPEHPQLLTAYKGADWHKIDRKWFSWGLVFDSLPARCYVEILDLINNEAELKECALCKIPFIPSRTDQQYCSWNAPGYPPWGPKRRTCKQIGPQKKFQAEHREDLKERKHFLNQLRYYKKTGQRNEWRKINLEFQRWKKKEVKHGTSRTER